VEGLLGTAYSVPTPLSLVQSGHGPVRLRARYATRPFSGSPYYAFRIGFWNEDRGWILELVHHKLFLENEPPEVQHFEISHGYNLVTVNRAWKRGRMRYGLGAGAVLAHPESEVRGRRWPEGGGLLNLGYYILGPTFQASAARSYLVTRRLSALLEAKVTASYARVPISGGHASAPNLALHLVAGMGFEL